MSLIGNYDDVISLREDGVFLAIIGTKLLDYSEHVVTNVERGSPASRAGIRPGHVITMVGQTAMDSPDEVIEEVEKAAQEGRPSVLLMIEQAGARRFVAVELAVFVHDCYERWIRFRDGDCACERFVGAGFRSSRLVFQQSGIATGGARWAV